MKYFCAFEVITLPGQREPWLLGLKARHPYLIYPLMALLLLVAACSTKKNKWINRTYHNTTSHYNGYFNARELIRESVKSIQEGYEEDYSEMLPIFIYGDEAAAASVQSNMNTANDKCSQVIHRHSMVIEGKERCNWIDDTWIVIGQTHFYKQDYAAAEEAFRYISKTYKDSPNRYLAMLWQARSQIERKNYKQAERILVRCEGNKEFPSNLKGEFNEVYADLYAKQENYEEAIHFLKKAIDLSHRKKHKTRMMYILAQMYQEEGDYQLSSGFYAQVIKRNPPYEMAFYARINRALAFDVNTGNSQEVRAALRKMLRDDKNIEFRDQIYYALAELDLAEDKEEDGIENLKNATEASVSNDKIKAKAFLKLAEIYFVKPNYRVAQAYYDSTVTFLPQDYPNYERIVGISQSLNRLVGDIETIETEDSLQRWAAMPRDELEAIIYDKIQDAKEEEELRQLEQEQRQLEDQQNLIRQTAGDPGIGASGDFWIYDPQQLSRGLSDFRRQWGTGRKLADNWRRSNKQSQALAGFQNPDEGDGLGGSDSTGGGGGRNLTPRDPGYYLKDVPFSDEAKAASHLKIVEAYYDLGLVYKDEMYDDPKAIQSFEELLRRYPENKYQLNSYYQLYLMYKEEETKDLARSNYYRKKILEEFEDSEFASVIKDPDYFEKKKAQKSEAEGFYKQTYGYFKQGYYKAALGNCEKAKQMYPGNDLGPQFDFIAAMSTGNIEGQDRLISELKGIQSKHNGHSVANEAGRILEYLLEGKAKLEKKKAQEEADRNLYSYEPTSKHSCMLLVPKAGANQTVLKNKISDFNKKLFALDGLKVDVKQLGKDTYFVTIKQFPDAAKAMKYYRIFLKETLRLKGVNDKEYPFFAVSYKNLAIFYRDTRNEVYQNFFNENYLKAD